MNIPICTLAMHTAKLQMHAVFQTNIAAAAANWFHSLASFLYHHIFPSITSLGKALAPPGSCKYHSIFHF